MPVSLIIHFLDGRDLTKNGYRAYHMVHCNVFDARNFDVTKWEASEEQIKESAQRSRKSTKKGARASRELAH